MEENCTLNFEFLSNY